MLFVCTAGHYVTYALNDTSRSWYAFNDALVVPVTEQTVKSCEAYVLFYRYRSLPSLFSFLLIMTDMDFKDV